jgi:hypothetical protein
MSGNAVAPEGFVYVCIACGKRSRDKYGDQASDYGWDESCMLHAHLARECDLVFDDSGRVKRIGGTAA